MQDEIQANPYVKDVVLPKIKEIDTKGARNVDDMLVDDYAKIADEIEDVIVDLNKIYGDNGKAYETLKK
jgi:nucleoid-associated protein YejK